MSFESCIARICNLTGTPSGAGVLVHHNRILTCAHVVNAALGIDQNNLVKPDQPVLVDFPLFNSKQSLFAYIDFWDGIDDIAVLVLERNLPEQQSPERLINKGTLWNHTFHTYGFPKGYPGGIYATGRFLAVESSGWLQLEDTKQSGYFLMPGFSGAPIWDDQTDTITGIVVATDRNPQFRTAFAIPIHHIARKWPALEAYNIECVQKALRNDRNIFDFIPLSVTTPLSDPSFTFTAADYCKPDARFPIMLNNGLQEAHDSEETNDNPSKNHIDIQSILKDESNYLILGQPGSGKTTVLRRIALESTELWQKYPGESPLPIYIKLSEWNENILIDAMIKKEWAYATDPSVGNAIFLLDGLNEMGARGYEKAKLLDDWIRKSSNRIIVTCRSEDYSKLLYLGLPILSLDELNIQQIERFVVSHLGEKSTAFWQWFGNKDNALSVSGTTLDLVRNPLLLISMILIYKEFPENERPSNTGQITQRIVEILLMRELKNCSTGITVDQVNAALANLAFAMVEEDQPQDIPIEYAIGLLGDEKYFRLGKGANLIGSGQKTIHFTHQLFQEYFASRKLIDIGISQRLGSPKFSFEGRLPDKWDPIIVTACGISDHSDQDLKTILQQDPYLAALCLANKVIVEECTRDFVLSLLMLELEPTYKSDVILSYTIDPSHYGRRKAARHALRRMGPIALPLLKNLLMDEDLSLTIRSMAVLSIGDLGSFAKDCVPVLCFLFDHPEQERKGRKKASSRLSNKILTEQIPSIGLGLLLSIITKDPKFFAGEIFSNTMRMPFLLSSANTTVKNTVGIREAIVWALAEIDDSQQVRAIVRAALQDEEAKVRKAAIYANLKFRETDIIPVLLNMVENDEHVRFDAGWALGLLGEDSLIGLVEKSKNKKKQVRFSAIQALGFIDHELSKKVLVDLLRDEKPEIRKVAVWALGHFSSESIINEIIGVLYDRDEDVVIYAIRALRFIKAGSAVPALGKIARQSTKQNLQFEAITALGEIGRLSAVHDLIYLAEKGKSTSLRCNSIHAMGMISISNRQNDNNVVECINKLMHDKDTSVRVEAIKTIGDMNERSKLNDLIKISQDNRPFMRALAIEAMGKIGDSTSIPYIEKFLMDKRTIKNMAQTLVGKRVCDVAVSALAQIGTEYALSIVSNWKHNQTK